MSNDSIKADLSKAAEKAVDLVGTGVGTLFKDAALELGGMLGDQMRYWRFNNSINIFDKVQHRLKERGVHADRIRALDFGPQFLALENLSFEESDEVQDLWAGLIASALDQNSAVEIEKRYIDLLRAISPPEAGLLHILWSFGVDLTFRSKEEVEEFNSESNQLAETVWRKYDRGVRDACVQNLLRLRCIALRPHPIDLGDIFETHEFTRERRGAPIVSLLNPRKFSALMGEIVELINSSSGAAEPSQHGFLQLYNMRTGGPAWQFGSLKLPELSYQLTPLGRDLMASCCPTESATFGKKPPRGK